MFTLLLGLEKRLGHRHYGWQQQQILKRETFKDA
jgi:hypothetical protein